MENTNEQPQNTEKLDQIAKDICENKIFTNYHISELDLNLVSEIFVPLGNDIPEIRKLAEEDRIGLVYEYLDKAEPTSIRGYPKFTTCNILTMDDATYVLKKSKEILDGMREEARKKEDENTAERCQ